MVSSVSAATDLFDTHQIMNYFSRKKQLFTLILWNMVGLWFAAALPQTAAPLFDGNPFVVIWNAPTYRCQQLNISLDLSVFQAVTTPQRVPNQLLTLLYSYRLGLFPYTDLNNLTQCNRGIPQNGNLTASLERFKKEVTQYIPASVPGLAVIDWEEWFPLFERNAAVRAIYKELSINYTLKQEPFLTRKKAASKAKEQFEKAAQSFMEETLKLGVSVRPQYLWGYYLFPNCYNYDYLNPAYTGQCPASASKLNDNLQWLWNVSTALFPSAYMPLSLRGSQKAALFVRNQVLEALRVSTLPKRPYTTPVYLYLRPLLRDQKEHYKSEADLIGSIGESAALGTAGCVLWGSSYDYNDKALCTALSTYLSQTLNPYIVNVTTAAKLCSNRLCQGKGRCVRKKYHSNDYLHLNSSSFTIEWRDQRYEVTGKLSTGDLTAWADKFTCQCYMGTNCTACIQFF